MAEKLVTAVCCTYKRPRELGNAIACFLSQSYPHKEMVVLDDTGMYCPSEIPNVHIISVARRFKTLGEKRNACAALASPNTELFCVWDDDDAYLPWHIEQCAQVCTEGYWLPPRVLIDKGNQYQVKKTEGLFHGSWCFTPRIFNMVRGYPFMQSGQDQAIFKLFKTGNFTRHERSECEVKPSYIYRWFREKGAYHLSAMGSGGYERLAEKPTSDSSNFQIRLTQDWAERYVKQFGS